MVGYFNTAASDLDADLLCQAVIAPSARGGSAEGCAGQVGPAMRASPENWNQITGVSDVQVRRDSASARGVQAGVRIPLTFERQAGRWWMEVFD